jgi:hypothetical protein
MHGEISRMETNEIRCESCGKLLDSPTKICGNCEIKREPPPFPNPYGIGVSNPKIICPNCGIGFNKTKEINWPENAPWYKYTTPRRACPSCNAVLISKYQVNKFIKSTLSLALALKIIFGYINLIHFAALWLSVIAYFPTALILMIRESKDIKRYTIDRSIECRRQRHTSTNHPNVA